MRIAVLTSSRADYGIYQPLLRRLEKDPFFDLEIIVFGTHLSRQYGYTISNIQEDGFIIAAKIESLILGDTQEAISSAIGLTTLKFSSLWAAKKEHYDLVFCLGDRYEMYAAVSAGIPFNIKFAHIHGGEKTLGAIDNTFRHCISLMSDYHFATTEIYADRLRQLLETENNDHVYNVGSLSLDNIADVELFSLKEFKEHFDIDLTKPTILFTWHPETVDTETNVSNIREVLSSLDQLSNYRVVITMPNSDTMGSRVRHEINEFVSQHKDRIRAVESFGIKGYFTCLEHCSFVMGNSSSGIIEAASFGKYVLNIGNRQKGRASGENVIHVEPTTKSILSAVQKIEKSNPTGRENIYYQGGAADQIINILKAM